MRYVSKAHPFCRRTTSSKPSILSWDRIAPPPTYEHARAALEAAYQKAGFATVSVTIPPQSISQSGGVVVVQVIERRVERLRVTGARYFLPSAVRAGAPSVAPARCRT